MKVKDNTKSVNKDIVLTRTPLPSSQKLLYSRASLSDYFGA